MPSLFAEHLIEEGGGLLLKPGHHVAIDVHGRRDRLVAQALLHDLGVDPLGEEQGCVGVPQVMEAEAFTPAASARRRKRW